MQQTTVISGRLNAVGRRGFRALAEIFQLHHADISGISVIVCGSADPKSRYGSRVMEHTT